MLGGTRFGKRGGPAVRLGALVLLSVLAAAPTQAIVYTVTNTADSGAGSLRQAITTANGTVGVYDTINFNIPGGGVHTINVASVLSITDRVFIDGGSQPGYVVGGAPLIELSGTAVGHALYLNGVNSSGSTIRALNIHGFAAGYAVRIRLS